MICINVVNIHPIITGKHDPTMSGKHRPAIDNSHIIGVQALPYGVISIWG
jgi:hypothetical protein